MAERERQVREELTVEVGVMKDDFERELDELRSTLDEEHNNELKKYEKSPSLVCCVDEKCALFLDSSLSAMQNWNKSLKK